MKHCFNKYFDEVKPCMSKPCESESEVSQLCRLFAIPRTVAYHPPLSVEFSRQEY